MDNENDIFESEKKDRTAGGKFWKGLFTGVVFTAVVFFCANELGDKISLLMESVSQSSQSPESQDGLNFDHIAQKANYMQHIIDRYFLFDEDYQMVEDSIYKGMIAGLDDPYAAYYAADEMGEVMESTTGVYYGIGAVVSQNLETGVVTITRVYPDSPAEKAGLLAGDVLYKVDGIEVTGEDLDLLVDQHVRGEQGTSVEIEVYRETINDYVVTNPVRDKVETVTIESEMLDSEVGYILLSQFENVSTSQFQKAVEDLESQGMKRLILDLRGNTGGTLDAAIGIMSYILPDGLLFYDEDKNGSGTKYISEDGNVYQITYSSKNPEVTKSVFIEDSHELDIPMVVLINGYTASASEALSSSLRDFDWATLVGTKTYGKGIVQTMMPLGDGSMIKLTTAQYYSKSGYVIHGQGLEPDVEIEFSSEVFVDAPYTKAEDNQIQKALEIVKEK